MNERSIFNSLSVIVWSVQYWRIVVTAYRDNTCYWHSIKLHTHLKTSKDQFSVSSDWTKASIFLQYLKHMCSNGGNVLFKSWYKGRRSRADTQWSERESSLTLCDELVNELVRSAINGSSISSWVWAEDESILPVALLRVEWSSYVVSDTIWSYCTATNM